MEMLIYELLLRGPRYLVPLQEVIMARLVALGLPCLNEIM